jgi:hypothetical protein
MAITVTPKNASIVVNRPGKIPFVLVDHSGAFTILTVRIPGHAPVSHAFGLYEGRLQVDVDLGQGVYDCTFIIQAFDDGANKMYDCALEINNIRVFSANGNIPSSATFDAGSGPVHLTV